MWRGIRVGMAAHVYIVGKHQQGKKHSVEPQGDSFPKEISDSVQIFQQDFTGSRTVSKHLTI